VTDHILGTKLDLGILREQGEGGNEERARIEGLSAVRHTTQTHVKVTRMRFLFGCQGTIRNGYYATNIQTGPLEAARRSMTWLTNLFVANKYRMA